MVRQGILSRIALRTRTRGKGHNLLEGNCILSLLVYLREVGRFLLKV